MKVFHNDISTEVPEGTTIAALLRQLELEPRYLAVEVNFKLISRTEHNGHVLQDGDRLEIVTLVGGG